jgi:Sulfotransferase family
MAAPISFQRRLQRKLPRLLKSARQWAGVLAAGRRPGARLVFVVGAQRSGTRLPIQVLDRVHEISTFPEGSAPYFDGVMLRPLERIEQLVRRSPARIVALKPICETHRTNELLDRFPGSKAIWIFRNFEDTVNSASLKWSSGRTMLRRLAHGQLNPGDWRRGGLTQEKLRIARRLYRADMSQHEANAVMWYLRNSLFFDLRCDERSEVLLVRYEDLVSDPLEHVTRIFSFVGLHVPPDALAAIRGGNRARRPFPDISPDIRRLCEDVHDRLLAHYRSEQIPVEPAAANHR